MKYKFLICFIFVSLHVHAQHEWDKWYFGKGAGLDFSTNPPTLLTGGKINTREGCSTFCDRETGDLLFYTDGTRVWNRNHQIMPNGSELKGDYSSTQSSIIFPMPGSSHRYYLFTSDNLANRSGYYYNIIDMDLDNYLGDIEVGSKNSLLYKPSTEKMTAVKHCNGVDYWVITHEMDSRNYWVYRVTSEGVEDPIIQSVGSFISNDGWNGAGVIKISENSSRLCSIIGCDLSYKNAKIDLFEFDNNTGELLFQVTVSDIDLLPYGAEFSPSGQYLYVSSGAAYNSLEPTGVYQFDISTNNENTIKQSIDVVYETSIYNFGTMQLTPYGQILVAKENGYNKPVGFLDVIRYPDSEDVGYEWNGLSLGSAKNMIGLPSFIANINYTPPTGLVEEVFCKGTSITINGTLYDESNPIGVEYIPITASTGCDSVVVVNLIFDTPTEEYYATLCPSQSITIENTTFNQANPSGQIIIPNGAQGGCDSIINVNISFDASAVSTSIFETELCQEDEIIINGMVYNVNNPSGTETIPNGAQGGCDSVINVNIIFLEKPEGEYRKSYCAGQEVEINGTIYNESNRSGVEIIENGSSKGCDSTSFINLTFDGVITELNPIFCPEEAIEINGTIYDENNPSGTEIFTNGSMVGCDSTVEINLTFYNDTAFIDTVFCNLDDSLVLGDQIFTINNTSGQFSLPNASFIGCDSIIDIHVLYQIDSNFISDTLCWYDSLFVNGNYYTQSNPLGIENMKSVDDCDSIVDLRLFFPYETVELEIAAPDTVCYGETVTLVANSNLEDPNYEWYKNDSLICEDCPTVSSQVIKTDVFKLFAEDKYGCELFLDQHRIKTTINYDVYFPNAITPNGDGINDKFTVFGNKKVKNVISMTIYDRWGEELFIERDFPVNNLHYGWDGFFDGKIMQPGVYVYVIFVEFVDGTVKQYAGDLTILL